MTPSMYRHLQALLSEPFLNRLRAIKNFRRNRADLARLIAQIGRTLPERKIRRAKLINSGFDNMVVIADRRTIFRFPRNELYRTGLLREARLLERLCGKTSVRIPEYSCVEPSGLFGCYEMIQGVELRPELFWSLDRSVQETLLLKAAAFLDALHGLPADIVQDADGTLPEGWKDQRFSHCKFESRRQIIDAAVTPDMMTDLTRFFAIFGDPQPVRARVVHADLVSNHFLFLPHDHLSIIDFSNTMMGDPAWDFAVLGSYGDWVLPFLLENYAFAAGDPGLAQRARRQAVRYWTERLYWKLTGYYHNEKLNSIITMVRISLRRVEGLHTDETVTPPNQHRDPLASL